MKSPLDDEKMWSALDLAQAGNHLLKKKEGGLGGRTKRNQLLWWSKAAAGDCACL